MVHALTIVLDFWTLVGSGRSLRFSVGSPVDPVCDPIRNDSDRVWVLAAASTIASVPRDHARCRLREGRIGEAAHLGWSQGDFLILNTRHQIAVWLLGW